MSDIDRIEIQHILVSFKETPVQAKRSKDEAESLATQLLERARTESDFTALVREFSDDPISEDDPKPGVYKLLNHGIDGEDFGAFVSALNGQAEEKQEELSAQIEEGELSKEDAETTMGDFIDALRASAEEKQASLEHPRAAMVPAFGDIGFALEVGAVDVAVYHEDNSPFGWHIIKRLV